MEIIFIGCIFVGIAGVMYVGAIMFGLTGGENDQVEDRLASLTSNRGRGNGAVNNEQISSLLRTEASGALDIYLKRLQLGPFIDQSGVKITTSTLIMTTLALFGGVTFLGMVLSPMIILAPIAGALVATVPYLFVWWKRKARLNKFGSQLPAAMDLMSQALRAGQSLPSGIQLVGEQTDEPLGPEFQRAFEEQNLGVALPDTMSDMADRVPNLDLRFLVTAIILQRQTGGDLAEILDKIAHLCRERFQIRGQIQALTGEGRMSGLVLLGLPPFLFLLMMYLNYDYIMLLFTDPKGQQMLGVALVMQAIGAFWINKIITIKV